MNKKAGQASAKRQTKSSPMLTSYLDQTDNNINNRLVSRYFQDPTTIHTRGTAFAQKQIALFDSIFAASRKS
jgi:hypothetical protein